MAGCVDRFYVGFHSRVSIVIVEPPILGEISMSLVEHRVVEAKQRSAIVVCNHTLHHRDQVGSLTGSWVESTGPYGVRVACGVCDKFFGYQPNEAGRSDMALYAAYLEQQRRLACPGCGEEPFLG